MDTVHGLDQALGDEFQVPGSGEEMLHISKLYQNIVWYLATNSLRHK